MPVSIRQVTPADVPQWLDLFRATVGDDYITKKAYDPAWLTGQLNSDSGSETWVAEASNQFQASISFLPSGLPNKNPVASLGRNLNRPESYADGSAEALLTKINEVALERGRMIVSRVLASDKPQQELHEKMGYACVGYQPFKHVHRLREGALFYVRVGRSELVTRFPLSEALPQIKGLATAALGNLQIPNPLSVSDGVTGYPLQTEVSVHDATYEDFELWKMQALASNPPIEVSGTYHHGLGFMRFDNGRQNRAVLGQREDRIVAGLAYFFDDHDRCLRIIDSFSSDDLSMGALFQRAVKIAQEQLSAVYLEADVLMTAPRLLKSSEQMGFVPVAYLPGFFFKEGLCADVVKLVKLNVVYSLENTSLTEHARALVQVVDHNFEEQKVGVAMINLLRALPIFDGLGDGELRKLTRLFVQKLYRPGDRVFNKGDSGTEAYVIMRGQIDIYLDESAKPIAMIGNGQIFGEFAFLDGAPRVAIAIANQPTILLVVQRQDFQTLVQHEPHLGMVVMRNVAMDLSNKLRKANAVIAALKK
jgi:hypothetical protein